MLNAQSPSPLDVYDWLYDFRSTRLSRMALRVKWEIETRLLNLPPEDIRGHMQLLGEITGRERTMEERGESYVFRATAYWRIGNYPECRDALRNALACYLPVSHEHTVIQWMLGLAQLNDPSMLGSAINNLEMALLDMQKLWVQAVRKNERRIRSRYDQHIRSMNLFLAEDIVI
jgi:hypothetical protein